MMRRGVQTHFTADHAIERVRERRTLKGIVHSAPNAGPVRITKGEIEGLPGTLKRMDCCILSWMLAINKKTAVTVANIHDSSLLRASIMNR